MTQRHHDPSHTQHWALCPAGRLELGGPALRPLPGAAASGTITPTAALGWIDLPGPKTDTLEARAQQALSLTSILDQLEARFPGYRWFIREAAHPAA